MGRWLAPLLDGPQHWVLHDRDPDLLHVAADDPAPASADGSPVTVETRLGDLSGLDPGALAGASLVTASALLDMLTLDELDHLVRTCVGAGCPALVTLSVTGDVRLSPGDPLDGELRDAFNDHQRRTTGGRTLLGPDAVRAAARAFVRLGSRVEVQPSPWRLGRRQRGADPRVAGRLGRRRLRAAARARHGGRCLPRAAGRRPRPRSPHGERPPPGPAGHSAGDPGMSHPVEVEARAGSAAHRAEHRPRPGHARRAAGRARVDGGARSGRLGCRPGVRRRAGRPRRPSAGPRR